MTSSAQTPEPTDEQRAVAMDALFWNNVPYEGLSFVAKRDVDAVARALAAAVQQERDKYERVADELVAEAEADQWVDGLNQWQTHHPDFIGAACRIRGVSR